MAEIFEHYHCADCGRALLPDQAVYYDGSIFLCVECVEQRDIASIPPEVKERYIFG